MNLSAQPSSVADAGETITVTTDGTFRNGSQKWIIGGSESPDCSGKSICELSSSEAVSVTVEVQVEAEPVQSDPVTGTVNGVTGSESEVATTSQKITLTWNEVSTEEETKTTTPTTTTETVSSSASTSSIIGGNGSGITATLTEPITDKIGGHIYLQITGSSLPSDSLTAAIEGEGCGNWKVVNASRPSDLTGQWMVAEFACSLASPLTISTITFTETFSSGTTLNIRESSGGNNYTLLSSITWN